MPAGIAPGYRAAGGCCAPGPSRLNLCPRRNTQFHPDESRHVLTDLEAKMLEHIEDEQRKEGEYHCSKLKPDDHWLECTVAKQLVEKVRNGG